MSLSDRSATKRGSKLITVGIPVRNEADNIVALIRSVVDSSAHNNISEIIIFDDASTDQTVAKIKSIKDETPLPITIYESGVNVGKAEGLNYLFKKASSRYLLTIDSDVILGNHDIKNALIEVSDSSASLATGWSKYTYSKPSLVKAVFDFSLLLLRELGRSKHFYLCWGGFMMFEKKFYKNISLPKQIHRIDGYLYLLCISKKFTYFPLQNVTVSDEKNFDDISIAKYFSIQKRSNSFPTAFKTFDRKLIDNEISLTLIEKVNALTTCILKHPIKGLCYVVLKTCGLFFNLKVNNDSFGLWRK